MRDSSRIEPIPPNIRIDIVSESGMTRSASRLEKKNNETSRIPPNKKKIIRGDSGDSWPVWNRGICLHCLSNSFIQCMGARHYWAFKMTVFK